eukprot:CAMPEP_0172312572 /NCGR_PEP_ID=MMETSP1058-20130122/17977_1 /TAXON_ID=83371 /ORGANISM="Detonula confervacea, Strain CCMP 353" /LENGTH=426 /DNA_ID=CAMNT_0013026073 /DNA_START=130 /DNA_END=1410 /DNA_ORIENTATION=-
MNNLGAAGDNSPIHNNRGGMNFNDPSASFAGGQMNPMAFMSQFPGMMGNMPNNPQDMMNMMGAYCQTANGGGGNPGGSIGAFANFPPNDGSNPQGMNMNPQAQAMAQMMRKRSMDMDNFEDVQPPAAKRPNFGNAPAADMLPLETNDASGAVASANTTAPSDDDDEKPASDSPAAPIKQLAVILASKEGIKFYSRNDVLCGRGGGTNVHPGNRSFRDLINANRRAYLKARKNDKPAISRSIVRTIREMNGRFLKKDEKLGLWFEIGDDGAREKTSQALRQRAPEMRKILFEDEQRQQQHQQQEMMMQRQQLMGMGQMGQGMGGNFGQMNPAAAVSMGGNMGNFNPGMGNPAGAQGGNNSELSQSLIAKYNMLHQKNWLAQEKNMILQRLAMSGLNSNGMSNGQNIDNMTTQTLLQQGMNSVTPRGA